MGFKASTGHFSKVAGKITPVLQSTQALAAETQELLHSECEGQKQKEKRLAVNRVNPCR